jgi:hypothetical protein
MAGAQAGVKRERSMLFSPAGLRRGRKAKEDKPARRER